MLRDNASPSLYGVTPENSTRTDSALWGKNQFNSTFPLALCLYMRDNDLPPVSVRMVGGDTVTDDTVWSMGDIVGEDHQSPFYQFEESFGPYAAFSRNEVDNIDLVVSLNGIQSIPLEVKLTVVPDSSTSNKPESQWGPEVVMRPVSSAHAMMGVAYSLINNPANQSIRDQVISVLRPAYNLVSSWDNKVEVIRHSRQIYNALRDTLKISECIQRPFLIQPIWRTKGQSLKLCEQCFDVFVWSDVAVMGIPVQEHNNTGTMTRMQGTGRPSRTVDTSTMTRTFREVARHVRSLYDLLQTGDYDYSGIYKGMSHGNQTDKAFAISGNASIKYLTHSRLARPILPRSTLNDIVLNGGEKHLKPERRFDAAVQEHMTNSSE